MSLSKNLVINQIFSMIIDQRKTFLKTNEKLLRSVSLLKDTYQKISSVYNNPEITHTFVQQIKKLLLRNEKPSFENFSEYQSLFQTFYQTIEKLITSLIHLNRDLNRDDIILGYLLNKFDKDAANVVLKYAKYHFYGKIDVLFSYIIGLVYSIDVFPDGRIATGSADGRIDIWTPNGELITILNNNINVKLKYLKVLSNEKIVVSVGSILHLWNIKTKKYISLKGHLDVIKYVGKVTLDKKPYIVSVANDRTIRLWNPYDGSREKVLSEIGDDIQKIILFKYREKELIFINTKGETVEVWDLNGGKHIIKALKHKTDIDVARFPNERLIINFSSGNVASIDIEHILDGTYRLDYSAKSTPGTKIITSGSNVVIVSGVSFEKIGTSSVSFVQKKNFGEVMFLTVLPNGHILVIFKNGYLVEWNLRNKEPRIVMTNCNLNLQPLILDSGKVVIQTNDLVLKILS